MITLWGFFSFNKSFENEAIVESIKSNYGASAKLLETLSAAIAANDKLRPFANNEFSLHDMQMAAPPRGDILAQMMHDARLAAPLVAFYNIDDWCNAVGNQSIKI